MTIVNASNATEGVFISPGSNQFSFDFRDPQGFNNVGNYSWITTGDDDVQVFGSGIDFDGDPPDFGVATQINIDLTNDNVNDVTITGITRPLPGFPPGFIANNARLSVITDTTTDFFNEIMSLNDTITGSDFGDTIKAGGGADTLNLGDGADSGFGENGFDTLNGGGGIDALYGGNGADDINGGNGADTLYGGAGADELTGGGGADTFDFNLVTDSGPAAANRDEITAFTGAGGGGGDEIDLSNIDANTSLNLNQTFNFLGQIQNPNPPATAAGSVWLRNEGGDTIVYATVNAGDAPELAIRIDDGGVGAGAYTAADFVL